MTDEEKLSMVVYIVVAEHGHEGRTYVELERSIVCPTEDDARRCAIEISRSCEGNHQEPYRTVYRASWGKMKRLVTYCRGKTVYDNGAWIAGWRGAAP